MKAGIPHAVARHGEGPFIEFIGLLFKDARRMLTGHGKHGKSQALLDMVSHGAGSFRPALDVFESTFPES
jgi:hypothetical protein